MADGHKLWPNFVDGSINCPSLHLNLAIVKQSQHSTSTILNISAILKADFT